MYINVDLISKIITSITALTAIPAVCVTILKYFYDKNKDLNEKRLVEVYVPFYKYFIFKKNIEDYKKENKIIPIYTAPVSLINLIRKCSNNLIPQDLLLLFSKYEFYIDLLENCVESLKGYVEDDGDLQNELEDAWSDINTEDLLKYRIYQIEGANKDTITDPHLFEVFVEGVTKSIERLNELEEQINQLIENKTKGLYSKIDRKINLKKLNKKNLL